jgi:hypothetical protein
MTYGQHRLALYTESCYNCLYNDPLLDKGRQSTRDIPIDVSWRR